MISKKHNSINNDNNILPFSLYIFIWQIGMDNNNTLKREWRDLIKHQIKEIDRGKDDDSDI
jgi:hypothetical protein